MLRGSSAYVVTLLSPVLPPATVRRFRLPICELRAVPATVWQARCEPCGSCTGALERRAWLPRDEPGASLGHVLSISRIGLAQLVCCRYRDECCCWHIPVRRISNCEGAQPAPSRFPSRASWRP